MIVIDGSVGEGGGQVVRTAVSLSAITGKAVKIINIRAKRCKPGLRPQHLKGILACKKMCNGSLKGGKIWSREIEFIPGKIQGGRYEIDVGTAGSTALILQMLIPVSLYAPSDVEIEMTGGTNVKWSIDFEYMKHIFGYYMKVMGINYYIKLIKHGFYPKGGGKVFARISPGKPKPLNLIKRGKFECVDVRAIAEESLKIKNVAERELKSFRKVLKPDREFIEYYKAACPGTSIHAHAHYKNCKLGSSVIGEKGITAEKLGMMCALSLKKQMDSGACVDEWMADQILPYMAFAGKGKIRVTEITQHAKTNVKIIENFLPVRFNLDDEKKIISVSKIV